MEPIKSLIGNYWKNIVIIVLLFFIFFMKKCGPEPSIVTVEIPEKKGIFKGKKPEHVNILEKSVHTKEYVYIKGEKVYISNPLNDTLQSENEMLKYMFTKSDSVNKAYLYNQAIAINAFSTTFEDENLVLNIEGIVRGEVQEITPNYTIKKQSIEVPQKSVVFRALGGVEVGNTLQLDKPTFKANLGFQNKSGAILNVGYDTDKRIWVGYTISIFSVKK